MADPIIPFEDDDDVRALSRVLEQKPVSIGRAPTRFRPEDMQEVINQYPQTPAERDQRVEKLRRHSMTVPVDDYMHSPSIETEAMSDIEAENYVNELKGS